MQPLPLVEGLTRSWVRVYTVAMPAEVQTSRRREIASDLWEHGEAARAAARGPTATAGEVLGRLLRGIPSDVLWRLRNRSIEVNLHFGIERSSGVLMLMVVLMLLGALIGTTYPPGTDEPDFTNDFLEYTQNPGVDTRALIFRFAIGPVTVAAAVLLFLTFRARTPRVAAAGAVALVGSGMLFVGSGVALVRLHTLAEVWGDGGAQGDAVWLSARDTVPYIGGLMFFAVLAFVVSFLAFGGAMARTAVVPRWLSRFSLGAAAAVMLGTGGIAFEIRLFWVVFMLGLLAMVGAFVITGGWLAYKGAGNSPPSGGIT